MLTDVCVCSVSAESAVRDECVCLFFDANKLYATQTVIFMWEPFVVQRRAHLRLSRTERAFYACAELVGGFAVSARACV